MENRDRDKINKNDSSTSSSDQESNFGQNIGRSRSWDKEPSRKGDSSESSPSSPSDLDEKNNRSSSNVEH